MLGDSSEKNQARRIAPLIKRHHLLLVSMLLVHTTAMEILPVALNNLVPPAIAVIVSVLLVLLAGEILPTILLTGKSLGANAQCYYSFILLCRY